MAGNNKFLVDMGMRIAQRRKQMCLTQEQLAELAEVSIKTVGSAENGQKALRPENIVRFARALNMDISYLLTGEVSDIADSSKLSHKEHMVLNQILDAFLLLCKGE